MAHRITRTFRQAVFSIILIIFCSSSFAQHSVARQWNEIVLEGIRNDFARPTVHARNLFHTSVAMYDAWAAYDGSVNTWLLGQSHGNFYCPFEGVSTPTDLSAARNEAISYAAYRLIEHRFLNSPGAQFTLQLAEQRMIDLGYDPENRSTDYQSGVPAALGNYITSKIIEFGFQDGSNEQIDYRNTFYEPINPPMIPTREGNPFIIDPNRWQPLFLDTFIDQSGNPIPIGQLEFQSPEWGLVRPFALPNAALSIYERDSSSYWVYHDPGPPAYIQEDGEGMSAEYAWGFSLVSVWGAHLDPNDGVMWDISPASLGNTGNYPTTIEGLRDYYKRAEGGDVGTGYDVNPATGLPYPPQVVPRGDYTRVLAEFWADGPDSETPPGHWYTILNYVNDHPELEKRFKGVGPELDDLEWDVKAYFALGGAMHDAAIAAWSVKGYYDYVRPISAIRYMADQGQSSDPALPSYNVQGIPLEDGFVELVEEGDPLAGPGGENIGKIKLYSWRGPDYIDDPETDFAGVGWILAENWWPYQRPSFVTPPFAGYVSGHSTYSRAASEVLTLLTGDPYFPGGVGEFIAEQNEFLVFEEGPSVDVVLQWATYYDASDQTSLSRIWGGIHPPVDDIPVRLIGMEVGKNAFEYAEVYFQGMVTSVDEGLHNSEQIEVYPNPAHDFINISLKPTEQPVQATIIGTDAKVYIKTSLKGNRLINIQNLAPGVYFLQLSASNQLRTVKIVVQ